MLKRMGSDWEPWTAAAAQRKRISHALVKLFVAALLFGVSFRLLFPRSGDFFPLLDSDRPLPLVAGSRNGAAIDGGTVTPVKDSLSTNLGTSTEEIFSDIENIVSEQEKCDLFTGEWIPNPLGPTYTNRTCRFIESPQNCMNNGRPDTGYLFWRWKPNGCHLPLFDAEKFLDAMRNKSWALIGDSILRNHAQSLICLLSKAEEPTEVYHDEQFKSRRWHFPSHNFTLSLIWSPFLIKAEIFENDDGESSSENRLHIDTVDRKWTDQYKKFDYIVISGGQWFLKTAIYLENNTVVGCHYCPQQNLTELGLEYPYRKVLDSLYHFIVSAEHKPVVIYRTWTPDHFEHGEWFNGGVCNRTEPYKRGDFSGRDVDHLMRRVEVEEFEKAANAIDGSERKARLKLLDTYSLSLLRPDGHSGPYRAYHPFDKDRHAKVQNDCLHWCLPGPVDAWNELILELVSKN